MTSDTSPPLTVRPGPALVAPATASCPLCHTVSPLTASDVANGQSWRCGRCGQRWDQDGLSGAAAYAAWAAGRLAPPA
jgi:predicted Zn finger-like uncharacterized protein